MVPLRRWLRQALGIVMPLVVVVGLAALALRGLDRVPAYLQPGTVPQSFPSIQAAERALGMRIPLPAYFPDYLEWPAASIVGRQRPGPQVSLTFPSRDGSGVGLVLHLARGEAERPIIMPLPTPPVVLSSRQIDLEGPALSGVEGVSALLVTGRGRDGQPYNRLSWSTGGYQYILITPYPVAELLRLARSLGP